MIDRCPGKQPSESASWEPTDCQCTPCLPSQCLHPASSPALRRWQPGHWHCANPAQPRHHAGHSYSHHLSSGKSIWAPLILELVLSSGTESMHWVLTIPLQNTPERKSEVTTESQWLWSLGWMPAFAVSTMIAVPTSWNSVCDSQKAAKSPCFNYGLFPQDSTLIFEFLPCSVSICHVRLFLLCWIFREINLGLHIHLCTYNNQSKLNH